MATQSVTALTSFLGSEGLWREGDTKDVPHGRAHELLAEKLVRAEAGQSPAEGRETKPADPVRETKPAQDLTSIVVKPAETKPKTLTTK